MDTVRLGHLMWAAILLITLALWLWSKYYTARVSRNQPVNSKWEQVTPMAECFDDEEGEFL